MYLPRCHTSKPDTTTDSHETRSLCELASDSVASTPTESGICATLAGSPGTYSAEAYSGDVPKSRFFPGRYWVPSSVGPIILIGYLFSAQVAVTGALTGTMSAKVIGAEGTEHSLLYIVGGVALFAFFVWWWVQQGRLQTHCIYRAWIPFDHRNGEGIAGKHGRPVLILEELDDGTVLVLEGTSKPTGYGSRLNIGLGGWCSHRDVTTGRVTYLRTDRCLRIQRRFIDRNSGPHPLPQHLLDQALPSVRPRVEDRLTPPPV